MSTRKLATILSIDVVGYSRMMQSDPSGLLAVLNLGVSFALSMLVGRTIAIVIATTLFTALNLIVQYVLWLYMALVFKGITRDFAH